MQGASGDAAVIPCDIVQGRGNNYPYFTHEETAALHNKMMCPDGKPARGPWLGEGDFFAFSRRGIVRAPPPCISGFSGEHHNLDIKQGHARLAHM